MKIVSKFKDYYDHVANILGVDETLRYERGPVEPGMYNGVGYPETMIEIPVDRATIDKFNAARTPREQTMLPYLRQSDLRAWLYVGGKTMILNREVTKWHGHLPVEFSPFWVDRRIDTPEWIDYFANSFAEIPVFIVYTVQTYNMALRISNGAPVLSENGVPKFIPAMEAYSAIQTWLENKRTRDDEPIPAASNEIKIVAAGFDKKISFRHRK